MDDFDIDDDDFTDEEIAEYLNETIEEYDNWNVNLDILVSNLTDGSKIFLSEIHEKVGDKILYMIYGYLNSENLIDYDELTSGGMSEFIDKLNHADTLNLIELFIDFKKQEVELTESEINFKHIITKLKRDVSTLKKKLSQPSIFINTRQFEERFGLSPDQQKGLRGRIHDPLPHTVPNGKTIMYEAAVVEKWLANYKKKN
ncbi:MAG: hypothetical protein U9Q29_08360 [Campylobacterota bacterium]|nr:hypothetical protein [Campylobacterota bacterium]